MKKPTLIIVVLCIMAAYGLLPAPTAIAEHIQCSLEDMTTEVWLACTEKRDQANSISNQDSMTYKLIRHLNSFDLCRKYAGESANALMSCATNTRFINRCHHLSDFDEAVECYTKEMRDYYD